MKNSTLNNNTFTKDNIKHFSATISIIAISMIVSILVYCFTPTTNSDMVEDVIWAEESLLAGRLLNPGFNYPYAIPVGANLFMLPFVAMMGTTQLANSLGMLLFFLLMTTTCIWFFRSFTERYSTALIGTAIVMMAFRSSMGENLTHHILYYQLGYVCFFGLMGGIYRWLITSKTETITGIIIILYSTWSSTNGIPTILLSTIPSLIAVFFIGLSHSHKISKKCLFQVFGLLLIGTIIGLLVYIVSKQGIKESTYIETKNSYTLRSVDEWVVNASRIPNDWFELFLLRDPKGLNIATFEGMETLALDLFGFATGCMPLVFICFWRQLKTYERLVLYGTITVWIVCLLQYIAFRGPEKRLLYNGMCCNFLLLSLLVVRQDYSSFLRRVLAILASLLACIFMLLFTITANWAVENTLILELESRNMQYGFATYWNANNNTVISDGNIKVRPVYLNYGILHPYYFNSDNEWYDKNAYNGDWFLLLTESEMYALQTAPIKGIIDSSKECFKLKEYWVLVFAEEQWNDLLFTKTINYNFINENWSRNCTTHDEKRYIHDGGVSYGPYIALMPNEECQVIITGENLLNASIVVFSNEENTTISLKPVYQQLSDTKIQFSITTEADLNQMEIAIHNYDNNNFTDDIVLWSEVVKVN